eukprot:5593328-Amphidinium_carterae.1
MAAQLRGLDSSAAHEACLLLLSLKLQSSIYLSAFDFSSRSESQVQTWIRSTLFAKTRCAHRCIQSSSSTSSRHAHQRS